MWIVSKQSIDLLLLRDPQKPILPSSKRCEVIRFLLAHFNCHLLPHHLYSLWRSVIIREACTTTHR